MRASTARVDAISDANDDNQFLAVQTRYKIPGKDEFDSIISKFANFESLHRQRPREDALYPPEDDCLPTCVFIIVTFSKLDNIREAYLKSHLSSTTFFSKLQVEHRLRILDGPGIFTALQRLYRKAHLLPNTIQLMSSVSWLQHGSVRIGALRGRDLVALYKTHGDSLFFENIRDFLGVTSGKKVEDRETVNQEIIKTITDAPQKMLERNNGLTFRAAQVQALDDNSIILQQGAIVNGCQTTMCIVHCGDQSNDCLVQVKVVEAADAWDIAKAANYQNPVARIELDLAKYLRPQLVQKAATDLGYGVSSRADSAAASILDAIHQEHIDYDEMKFLYLGFFSRKPNNLFDANYTELRADVLEALYREIQNEKDIFATLFLILKSSRMAVDKCSGTYAGKEYSPLFKRFFHDEKPQYRAYLAVLSICGALRANLSERSAASQVEADRMKEFFSGARQLLENRRTDYEQVFLLAFQVLADTALEVPTGLEAEVAQLMHNRISKSPFNTLFYKLLLHIDTLSKLKQN